jgi:hypothetical protein
MLSGTDKEKDPSFNVRENIKPKYPKLICEEE